MYVLTIPTYIHSTWQFWVGWRMVVKDEDGSRLASRKKKKKKTLAHGGQYQPACNVEWGTRMGRAAPMSFVRSELGCGLGGVCDGLRWLGLDL